MVTTIVTCVVRFLRSNCFDVSIRFSHNVKKEDLEYSTRVNHSYDAFSFLSF